MVVVLLHGLGRTRWSLEPMRWRLERAGFRTWSVSYPSRSMSIAKLAVWVSSRIAAELPREPLLAVTHSLGGVLLRHMGMLPWRGAVMLAPPNQGSHVARALRRRGVMRGLYGPVLTELGAEVDWPNAPCPVAVIAGTRPDPLWSPRRWLLRAHGALHDGVHHDGVVTVDETKLKGMTEHHTLYANHATMPFDGEVRALAIAFLRKCAATDVQSGGSRADS